MGFCYGERTVDVGQTMGLKAPLVWVTPSTSINNYESKAQDLGHVQKLQPAGTLERVGAWVSDGYHKSIRNTT